MPVFINRHKGSGGVVLKPGDELYSFVIDDNIEDPAERVSYEDMCAGWEPVKTTLCTDYSNNDFSIDLGNWKDAWFMDIKPCMLRWSGSVDYYLDPNDYEIDINGNDKASEIKDKTYEGNVMVEFPKVYWRMEDLGNGRGKVSICNRKIAKGFECWSHIDADNKEIPYCYISPYVCSGYNSSAIGGNVYKSVSGVKPSVSDFGVFNAFRVGADRNNVDIKKQWSLFTYAELQLLRILTMMICKTTDVQDVFGVGNHDISGGGQNTTGICDKYGLFFGTNINSSRYRETVKVFGIEDLWANLSWIVDGFVLDRDASNNIQLRVKMTRGTYDGSSVDDYNDNGEGYIVLPDTITYEPKSNIFDTSAIGGLIKNMSFTKYGFIPKDISIGGATSAEYMKYYADRFDILKRDRSSDPYHDHGLMASGAYPSGSSYSRLAGVFKESYSTVYKGSYKNVRLSCKPYAA